MLCNVLKSRDDETSIQLSLALLLLHRCNIEAITLARERKHQGGMLGRCLASGSLLPPVKETMCSEELLLKIQSATVEVPG